MHISNAGNYNILQYQGPIL